MKSCVFIYMKKDLIKKIEKNYSTIQLYIKKNGIKHNISFEIQEELLPELILFLMEPFEGNSMEDSIRKTTLTKRRLKIEEILRKENTDFLKYCYKWINNNISWTENLFYKRSHIMADDSLEFSNDNDETISIFEQILQDYNDKNCLDEYLEDLSNVDEEKLIILRNIVYTLPPWSSNLYQLYFRDGNNLAQTAKIVGLSTTSIYNLVNKLKLEITNKYNTIRRNY